MKRALITGDMGFVGRHFRSHLAERGWTVWGCDTRRSVWEDCRRYFTHKVNGSVDLAIHCAAVIPPIDERERSCLPQAVDLALDQAYFEWVAKTRPAKAVYFSSAAVYPLCLQQPGSRWRLRESDALQVDGRPDALYGLTKLAGEMQAQSAGRMLVVRPFSGYGADQAQTYPFPALVSRVLSGEDPVSVWGNGTQVRDWVHVDDIVDCVMALLDSDEPGPVNIGTGRPTSLRQLAEMVSAAAGSTRHLRYDLDKPTGAHYRVADVERMNRAYTARVTLEEGIERAVASWT